MLQNTVARPLQPESFTYPTCDLFCVDRTFRLDDRKSEAADLGCTEIEEAATMWDHKRAFPIFAAAVGAAFVRLVR